MTTAPADLVKLAGARRLVRLTLYQSPRMESTLPAGRVFLLRLGLRPRSRRRFGGRRFDRERAGERADNLNPHVLPRPRLDHLLPHIVRREFVHALQGVTRLALPDRV